MKHIHFVIYRLKSIVILFDVIFFFLLICIHLEIKFIKTLDNVKIQRKTKTITFTDGWGYRTVFINKMINSGIMRMFIFFYNFYICIFCFVSQVLCICTDDDGYFSMRNIFFYFNDFVFYFFLFDKE
jgi:hypothetical protein